jgi:hypothetical protein
MINIIVGAGAVGAGAGAASRYHSGSGSGSDQKMRLLAAPALQHCLQLHAVTEFRFEVKKSSVAEPDLEPGPEHPHSFFLQSL